MLTRVPEEIRQAEGIKRKAIGLAGLLSQEPLKFQFYYGDENNPDIINTIYLKDGDAPLKLYLKVFNDSNEVVTFKDPKGSENPPTGSVWDETASEKNCHFHLHFEKDLGLNPDEIEIEPNPDSGQWQVNYDDETNFFAVYFLHKQELSLPPHEGITICFLNLTANNRTVKTSNVEVLYGGKDLVWKGEDQEDIEDEITSRIAISVINHPSKTKIPLQFRVLGSNKILNDGTTKNTLRLKVINSPLSNNERKILSLDQSSKFIVSFEQGEHPDALVATTSQLNAVQINVKDPEDWAPEHTTNSTQWSFTPRAPLKQLTAGQGIELTISDLVTSSDSGLACIYIDYQNIGSYPDRRLVIPIEKTPLLYSGENVGIGINNPQAKLHVNGGDAVISGKVGIGTTTPKIHLAIGDDDTGLQQQGDGILAIYTNNAERVRINSDGKVGIGLTDISHRLTIYSEDEKTLRLIGPNSFGVGAQLNFGDNNEVYLTENEDKKLLIHADTQINLDSPSVGIGTTDISHRLTIYSTDEKTLRLIGPNSLGVGAQLNFGDRNEVYLTENEDKKLLIHADTQINLDSPSVGIGTNDPKAKLDVNGSASVSGSVNFGESNRQMLNLWSTSDGIGIQNSTVYFRTGGNFAWYKDGVHNDAELNAGGGTALMVIDRLGNVGIGTTTPKAKLHVNGRIRLDDVPVWNGPADYDVTWGYEVSGDRYNVICREGSSERYKQNIMPLEDDFQKILTLEPKAYQMKEGHGNKDKWQFGYIAEELDQVGLKSLVVYDKSGRPDGIQYKKMCIYLNEVLKNQQNYLERLENKVNELNQKLTAGQ